MFWTGFGILTPFLVCVAYVFLPYNYDNMWGLPCIVGGVLNYPLGKKLNRPYMEHGVMRNYKNTFYFIKMEYWGFIFPAIGIIKLLFDL